MNKHFQKRVLIVDDDRNLTTSLRDFLESKGYSVTTAENGEQALEILPAAEPHIILLDISMEGMGGTGFLKHILRPDGNYAYPVLVFTARSGSREYFESLPVDGFISKPCNGKELIEKIDAILDLNRETAVEPPPSNHGSLLLGEDDDIVAAGITRAFENRGLKVLRAVHGPELMEMAAVHPPEVIVLKQILPRINGQTLASLLHSMPRTQQVPVILYDNSGMLLSLEEVHSHGDIAAVHRFVRSNTPAALLDAVSEVLAPRPAPADLSLPTEE